MCPGNPARAAYTSAHSSLPARPERILLSSSTEKNTDDHEAALVSDLQAVNRGVRTDIQSRAHQTAKGPAPALEGAGGTAHLRAEVSGRVHAPTTAFHTEGRSDCPWLVPAPGSNRARDGPRLRSGPASTREAS